MLPYPSTDVPVRSTAGKKLPMNIPDGAIKVAVKLFQVCNFHAALISGREVTNGKIANHGTTTGVPPFMQPQNDDDRLQQFVLMHPGPIKSATHMTNVSKFRNGGGSEQECRWHLLSKC